MDEKKERNVDILEYIGGSGFFQISMFIIVAPIMYFNADSVSMNFLGGFMDHWCDVAPIRDFSHGQQKYIAVRCESASGNADGFSQCSKFNNNFDNYTEEDYWGWNRTAQAQGPPYPGCDGMWVYDRSLYTETVRNRFNLVCDDSWKVEMLSTIFMAGRLFGSIACGFVSDWYGRKVGMTFFNLFRILGALMCMYAPNYPVYAVARFILATGGTGSMLCAYVLVTEIFDNNRRSIFSTLWLMLSAIGYTTLPIFAYFIRADQQLQAILTWPIFVFLLIHIAVPESALWLVSKEKTEDAEKTIRFIADCNKRTIPAQLHLKTNKVGDEKAKENFIEVFRHPNLRIRTLVIYLAWFTDSLVYFGLSLNTGRLSGNVYLNNFLFSIVEIPADFITIFALKKAGRRLTLGVALAFSGVSCLICAVVIIVNAHPNLLTAFAILGKAGITAGFCGSYIYSSEIFPTSVRNVGVGSSSMISRVGGMLAPFVGGPLENVWKPLPSVIFGLCGTVAGVLVLAIMPETLNSELPNTIAEAEAFKSKRRSAAAPQLDVTFINDGILANHEKENCQPPLNVTLEKGPLQIEQHEMDTKLGTVSNGWQGACVNDETDTKLGTVSNGWQGACVNDGFTHLNTYL